MKMPDVNIIVYAHRRDQDNHSFFRERLERLVNSESPFGLSALVSVAFIRIVTHSRFPNSPTPLPVALTVIDQLCASPNCRWILPGERHWELTRRLCERTGAAGKLVADAQHAAVAVEHGCRWLTRDDDFAKFEPYGLEWEHLVPGRSREV